MDAAIANARHGAFSDAFFFGVETISTIGYGQMSPTPSSKPSPADDCLPPSSCR
jgi:hypothetical protein